MQLGEQHSTSKGRFARDHSQVIFMHCLGSFLFHTLIPLLTHLVSPVHELWKGNVDYISNSFWYIVFLNQPNV